MVDIPHPLYPPNRCSVFLVRDEFSRDEFMEHINLEIVKAQRVSTPEGEAVVKDLIERHVELTGSLKGKYVLDNWEHMLPRFWQIVPPGELHPSHLVVRPVTN